MKGEENEIENGEEWERVRYKECRVRRAMGRCYFCCFLGLVQCVASRMGYSSSSPHGSDLGKTAGLILGSETFF